MAIMAMPYRISHDILAQFPLNDKVNGDWAYAAQSVHLTNRHEKQAQTWRKGFHPRRPIQGVSGQEPRRKNQSS